MTTRFETIPTGDPAQIIDSLCDIRAMGRIAVLDALAAGDESGAVEMLDKIHRIASGASWHIAAWHERATSADKAGAKAIEKIEARVSAGLRLIVESVSQEGGFDPRGNFVYLLWEQDKVIYVGLSRNVLSRLGQHMIARDRRYRVDKVTTIRCRTSSHMQMTEARLIRDLRPPLNIIGVA